MEIAIIDENTRRLCHGHNWFRHSQGVRVGRGVRVAGVQLPRWEGCEGGWSAAPKVGGL